MTIDIHAGQIQGARESQEDELGFVDTRCGLLAAVADGLGGHPWGEVASKLAITACLQQTIEFCDSDNTTPLQLLEGAFIRAHQSVSAQVHCYRDMGTTLAAVYIKDQVLYHGWVGDSLIFRLRGGELQVLGTRWDRTGGGTDALMYEERLQIRGLDEGFPVQSGDRYLLATDGITILELDDIRNCLQDASQSAEAVAALIQQVQAQKHPAQDNCTVICLSVS